ncbi:alpha/beta hydrolase [Shewanella sp. AS1]|uniref:alpha/beta hydrolase n=1 Tax=Shewanella sp. AS1 TaxID=2907626 RepID=UPI001F32BC51|nr:alpha/beta hydrolase [Shewanella sp. AS1]MCE9678738.1 alpha/beta hydrolase [Shewanella sp. AS1]
MKLLHGLFILLAVCTKLQAETLFDEARDRSIPIEITQPSGHNCSAAKPCPVAFVSAGYGMAHTQYGFMTATLSRLGYLVIAIGHELPQDPPLAVSGDLFVNRSENWQRGAQTLAFVQQNLSSTYPNFDFNHLLLVGHSNGGDISVWLAAEGVDYVKQIITLDNRRVPLPRDSQIKVLSIRAGDFPADNGVLPTQKEREDFPICVVTLNDARHNDMSDLGPAWLRSKISQLVESFINEPECEALL